MIVVPDDTVIDTNLKGKTKGRPVACKPQDRTESLLQRFRKVDKVKQVIGQ